MTDKKNSRSYEPRSLIRSSWSRIGFYLPSKGNGGKTGGNTVTRR